MKHTFQSREIADLSESVQHRLNQYTLLAGVGMLAIANSAEAKIVYTPAHMKIPFGGSLQLDLNHDGINDFVLSQSAGGRYFSYSWVGAVPLMAHQGNAIRFAYSNKAAALHAGVRVTGSRQNSNTFMFMAVWHSNGKTSKNYYGPWANQGEGVHNRYLGLKFMIKGRTHYGWARLNVAVTGGKGDDHFHALLTGYAYETIPNKAIITGKTKGPDVTTMPDNVGTLGHLALGRK